MFPWRIAKREMFTSPQLDRGAHGVALQTPQIRIIFQEAGTLRASVVLVEDLAGSERLNVARGLSLFDLLYGLYRKEASDATTLAPDRCLEPQGCELVITQHFCLMRKVAD